MKICCNVPGQLCVVAQVLLLQLVLWSVSLECADADKIVTNQSLMTSLLIRIWSSENVVSSI